MKLLSIKKMCVIEIGEHFWREPVLCDHKQYECIML